MFSFRKINTFLDSMSIPISEWTCLMPTVRVRFGTIGTNMEIGLSANADTATLEGGTAITAVRTLTTASPIVAPTIVSGSTAAVYERAGSTAFMGLNMANSGSVGSHCFPIPNCWDRAQEMYIRPIWLGTSTGGTPNFGVLVDAFASDVALGTDVVTVNGATQSFSTANTWVRGNRLTLPKNSIVAADEFVQMSIISAGGTANIYLLGMEIEFHPRLSPGRGRTSKAWTAS